MLQQLIKRSQAPRLINALMFLQRKAFASERGKVLEGLFRLNVPVVFIKTGKQEQLAVYTFFGQKHGRALVY